MNTRNTEKNPLENKDVSIKLEEDSIHKLLEKIEQKKEEIQELKLAIKSLKDQVKGFNNSHMGPTHNVFHKVKIDLPRFDGENH